MRLEICWQHYKTSGTYAVIAHLHHDDGRVRSHAGKCLFLLEDEPSMAVSRTTGMWKVDQLVDMMRAVYPDLPTPKFPEFVDTIG